MSQNIVHYFIILRIETVRCLLGLLWHDLIPVSITVTVIVIVTLWVLLSNHHCPHVVAIEQP